MKTKKFLICWAVAFIVVFGLNGIFHGAVAADYFDKNLAGLEPAIHKMKDTNPLWVALLDLILSFGMTYFILVRYGSPLTLGRAAFEGGLLNLISSGAWNFANASLFNWPAMVTVTDMCWHVMLGCFGGLLLAVVYKRFGN